MELLEGKNFIKKIFELGFAKNLLHMLFRKLKENCAMKYMKQLL